MKKYLIFVFLLFAGFLASPVLATGTVDINIATLAQLDTLTGIGPVYAQRIIDNRPYSSVDDLDKVKGIGPATLQKIKTQGLACVNCGTTQTTPPPTNIPVVTPTPENQKTNTVTAPIVYPSRIFINEILPSPQGADETDEWIELYNSNNVDVDLSNWQLQDRAGTITTHSIPSITKIMANSFLVFKRPETKIMLNNDGDGINLLTPDKKIVDSLSFTNAPTGQSYNKISGTWAWSTTLTQGAKNVVTAVTKPVSSTKILPKTQISDNNGNIKAEDLTAGLGRAIPTGKSPWPLFLTVLISTIIVAIIVLLIKIRFLKPKT